MDKSFESNRKFSADINLAAAIQLRALIETHWQHTGADRFGNQVHLTENDKALVRENIIMGILAHV